MKNIHSFIILAYNESDDLEECIKSIKNQSIKSNILIATSTKNDYIIELASQYGLGVMINDEESNKGNDYNFALNAMNTELITIVHQDDLYDRNYAKEVINCYQSNKDASIIFTDFYEIKGDQKIKNSKNLFKKRIFIYMLKYRIFNNKKFFKRLSLRFYKAICTSSITFVKSNIDNNLFPTDLKYNNDWAGLEKLTLFDKRFVLIPKKLVGYRIDDKKMKNLENKKEDMLMYKKFWNNRLIDWLYNKDYKRTLWLKRGKK